MRPEHTRSKKGTSGNPRGRPRKRTEINTIFQRVLDRKVRLKELDQKMTTRDALIWKLRYLALKSDKQVLALQRRILTEAGYDIYDPKPNSNRKKLFKEIGDRLEKELHQKEDPNEG